MRLSLLFIVLAVSLLCTARGESQAPIFSVEESLAARAARSKRLQQELKMDKDQIAKLHHALAKVRQGSKGEMAQLMHLNLPEEERMEITQKLHVAEARALSSLLKPNQLKRLHQIENQQAGPSMFAWDDVQKSLELTEEQKEKIDEINRDLQKDLRELVQGARDRGLTDPEVAESRRGLQKSALDNIIKFLNDHQKAVLRDLLGEPFVLPRDGYSGFAGAPQSSRLLSPLVQDRLKLTPEQKARLQDLQQRIDARLGMILSEEQRKRLNEMMQGGGRGGRRGPPDRDPGRQ